MRNWRVALAASVLVALPLCAQQRDTRREDDAKATSDTAGKSAGVPDAANIARGPRDLLALPAPRPRPTPFPAAAPSKADTPVGQLVPRYETAVGYSYVNFLPGDPFDGFNNHGATGSFTYNGSKWLGLTGEIGSYHFNRNISGMSTGGNWTTFLFGPRLNLRRFNHIIPFAEFLFGGANGGQELVGGSSQTAFALATGGGVDVALMKNLAWRFVQLDYLMTSFSGAAVGPSARQDSFRVGTGLVLRWGFPNAPPPPVNHPPVAACSASPVSVYEGSGDSVAVHVNASDPDNDPLTYSYTATGGTVEGTGPDGRWNMAGLGAGTYTLTVKVDDGRGGVASCTADIKVEQKPNHPPVISCAPDHSPILPGEHAAIISTASDPDNDPLTYSYTATGGQITGSGAQVRFDAAGLQPGTYTVKCMVSDGRGGNAEASTTVDVKEPPQIKQLEVRLALHSIYFPTALPTVTKPNGGLLPSQAATLDTLATDFKQYLTYRPDAHLVLEGHADARGPKEYNIKLSERRVERTKSYLVEHGVPADHIETKAFGFEQNMTDAQVKALIEQDQQLAPGEKQKILKNLLTVRLANNRRVDVTLSTTGEQSIRRFPFSAKDALTLLSRGGAAKEKPKTAVPKKPAKP
jgi:outer membrane protein OmpA-like peptidoglycan-associated protein/opacity protein-like surface antigen